MSFFSLWEANLTYCLNKSVKREYTTSGLINGRSGLILLYAQLYDFSGKELYLKKFYEEVDLMIEAPCDNFSLGYGIASFAWIMHLVEDFNLFSDIFSWFANIDTLLESTYFKCLEDSNTDYFEGALGILFYFLERKNYPKHRIEKYIKSFCDYLNIRKTKEDWMQQEFEPSKNLSYEAINLGVPHGLTGVLLLLLKIKEKGYDNIDLIISDVLELILQFELHNKEHGYPHFPMSYRPQEPQNISTIGWCYGDLMIGYASYKAGILLQEKKYTDYGLNILLESTSRDSHFKDKLVICHGYPSLAHIYRHIYFETQNKIFWDRSTYWRKKSVSLFRSRYENYLESSKDEYFENPSLFYGFSGFFLSELAFENEHYINWTNCLLL